MILSNLSEWIIIFLRSNFEDNFNMKEGKNNNWVMPIMFIIGIFIGLVGMYLFLNWVKPVGWVLSAKGYDTSYLNYEELKILRELLRNGSLFSTSDIIENFIAYYHMLITILITIMMVLAGFVTYNFYRSRLEYNEQMDRELKKFFKIFERNCILPNEGKSPEFIDEYEELQSWLQKKIYQIITDPSNDYGDIVKELIVTEIINDKEFLSDIKQHMVEE